MEYVEEFTKYLSDNKISFIRSHNPEIKVDWSKLAEHYFCLDINFTCTNEDYLVILIKFKHIFVFDTGAK